MYFHKFFFLFFFVCKQKLQFVWMNIKLFVDSWVISLCIYLKEIIIPFTTTIYCKYIHVIGQTVECPWTITVCSIWLLIFKRIKEKKRVNRTSNIIFILTSNLVLRKSIVMGVLRKQIMIFIYSNGNCLV